MKRKSILFLYILLLAIGLAYETQSLTEGWMSGSQYGIVGLSTLILLVYALPAVWALFHFSKKWKLSCVPVLFSLLGGGFVAGWLSSFANTYFHDMIQAIAPNSDFWNQYESAIAAPLFEEPFKLIPIFFVLYLFSVRRIKSIFLLAIASGLGFQIVEDFAVRVQKTRKVVIPADMLGNAVNELDDGLRLALRRPDRAVQAAAAAGIEIKFFHKERSFRIGRIDFHL